MSFFKSIEQHLEGLNLNVVISKNENGLTVSVLPQPTCKDDAMKSLTPILLKGTAEELDAQFAGIIQQPLQKVSGISTNLVQFEKNVEIQAEKTAIVKAKKDADKKLTDKADKYIKEAEALIEKDETKKAILKAKAALKVAPEYKKALDLMDKLVPKAEGMFVAKEKAKLVEQVKEEMVEVVMASEPTAIAEKPLVDLSHIPNTLADKTPIIIGAGGTEIAQVRDALAEAGLAAPTSMKEVATEEQQEAEIGEGDCAIHPNVNEVIEQTKEYLQENPVPATEAFVANDLKGQPKPKRLDLESMENYEIRLASWREHNPPIAETVVAAPIVEEMTPMEEMAREDMVKREAEFEADKAIQPEVKAETPRPSASDHIEILG
jgi:PRTRC genetic system protein E